MTDRSQAASAGLRDQRNIELMIQRRHKTHDDDGLGDTALDEKDIKLNYKGQKIQSNYYIKISNEGESQQREMQKSIDLPPLIYFSKEWKGESNYTSQIRSYDYAKTLKFLPIPIE